MTCFRKALFMATVAASAISTVTQAQTNIPVPATNDGDVAIHGTGASSIQNVLVQELNCIAKHNPLGVASGALNVVPEPTNLPIPAIGGTFDCSQDPPTPAAAIEPNFNAKYVATGSGFGRQAYRRNTNQFGGTTLNGFGTWNTVQFAFADSSLTASDLSGDYATNIAPVGGPAVQFPKYVLPVAFAYSPIYGSKAGVDYRFNVRAPKNILGVLAGGLQLNATTYCKIWNGQIVNWNDPEITADNTPVGGPVPGTVSLKDVADAPARWNTDGVPIRLVGRLDRSGTTDIFTRHLSTVCAGTVGNKFTTNAETLPYNPLDNTLPDFSVIRNDTGLKFMSGQPTAGTTSVVSSDYYNGSVITNAGVINATSANGSTPVGAAGTGRFIVADGSGRMAGAIALTPDYPSPTDTAFLLNGKIGYIGADFIPPAPNAPTGVSTLHAAALKNTTSPGLPGAYIMPSAAAATAAVGATTPPAATLAARSNPLNWYNALYPVLANPPAPGYPVTGTTQFLGYTCYKAGNLENVRNFLGWNMQSITTDYTGASKAGIFSTVGTSSVTSGLLPRSNIGVLPANWRTAIVDTFLSDPNGWNLQIVLAGTSPQCTSRTGM